MPDTTRIAVVGLGYVGLPLALALARSFPVVGFDIDERRIDELKRGYDRTNEVDEEVLRASDIELSEWRKDIQDCNVFIVTVPTPVDGDNKPDLSLLERSCVILGPVLKKGAVVAFESTVYPGVTEDFCGPVLERESGLEFGRDFFVGYSPERINPGDREHTVERIDKIVAGQTEAVTDLLCEIYGAATTGAIHRAASIKVAEAAKVIENAQRDVNIAFMNEVAVICNRLGISSRDVLEAASTKWNFLPFRPGLVGGHCIGVDPYYLAHVAQELGHDPQVVLSGRRINDSMPYWVADRIHDAIVDDGGEPAETDVLVMGVTFKENIPDLRNSGAVALIHHLQGLGYTVQVHDPHADPDEVKALFGIDLVPRLSDLDAFDCVVGAVGHDVYRKIAPRRVAALLKPGGLLADLQGLWRDLESDHPFRRWEL